LTKLSSVRTSPKWSFKGKPASPKKPETPGPGEYQGNLHLNAPSSKGHGNPNCGFGCTTPRVRSTPQLAPGPGAYSPSHPTSVSTKHSFATSPRHSIKMQTTPNPGPGSYVHKDVMGCEGPKFTASPRRQDLHRSSTLPGPGSYEVPSCAVRGRRYSFGTSPRSIRKHSMSPGPGAYGVNAENRKASPKPTMGYRREAPKAATSPGPGEYCGAHTTFGY